MGMKEICLTAHHEGGFALWPSKFTEYSVARSLHWHGGRGDVLRAFADAANRAGINICYYINTPSDGYEANVEPLGGGVHGVAGETFWLVRPVVWHATHSASSMPGAGLWAR